MTPGESPVPPLEPYAAQVLGVELTGKPEELRAALLRRLVDEDFLPEPSAHEALRVLSGRPVGPGSWLAEEAAGAEEARLRDEVEDFASRFFATPAGARRDRWQSLMRACAAHERLVDRLQGLSPGLDIDPKTLSDRSPRVNRLIGAILTEFVCRPRPRALMRRQLLRDLQADTSSRPADWVRAMKQLLRRRGEIAVLARGLPAQLAQPRRSPRVARRRARRASLLTNLRDNSLPDIAVILLFFIGSFIYYIIMRDSNAPRASRPGPVFPPVLDLTPRAAPSSSSAQVPSPAFLRGFHDQFKAPIRRELAKFGKALDEERLQRVVDALPSDVGSRYGSLTSFRLLGLWTDGEYDRYVGRLRTELARAGVDLDDRDLETVARNCFPKPVGEGPLIPGNSIELAPELPSRREN